MASVATEELLSPSESVAIAVHVSWSPTLLSLADMVYVAPVAMVLPLMLHIYKGVRTPSSGSLTLEVQVTVSPVYTGLG